MRSQQGERFGFVPPLHAAWLPGGDCWHSCAAPALSHANIADEPPGKRCGGGAGGVKSIFTTHDRAQLTRASPLPSWLPRAAAQASVAAPMRSLVHA